MERTPATGGLNVDEPLGISVRDLDLIVEKFETQRTVEEDLKKMGFTEVKQPAFELPEITSEMLNTLDDVAYTTMYAQQLAWQNYVSPALAQVTSSLLQAETQVKLVAAAIRKSLRKQNQNRKKEDRMKEDDIENEVLTDPVYQDVLLEAQKYKQYKTSLETYHEIAGRNMRVISRQIEIRKLAFEGEQRQNNLPGRGTFQPRPIGSR